VQPGKSIERVHVAAHIVFPRFVSDFLNGIFSKQEHPNQVEIVSEEKQKYPF